MNRKKQYQRKKKNRWKLLSAVLTAALFSSGMFFGPAEARADVTALAPSYNADVSRLAYVTDVEDQSYSNYCWAYMADAVLESYLMKNQGAVHPDFSETDMFQQLNGGTHGFADISTGGSYHQAVAYWTRGTQCGPRMEADNSLSDYYVSETAELGRYAVSDERSKQNYIQGIKNLVASYGAAGVSIYFRDTGRILTTRNGAYYYPQETSPGVNHGVTVVGWDDNFYQQWFYNSETTPQQPKNKGAFLVKNSWGKNDETSIGGNTGYYWISYENYFQDAFAVTNVVKRSELYDEIYETDYRGFHAFTPGTSYNNLYELKSGRQFLTGFSTYVKEGGYYRFYINGQELTQFSGRAAQSGYRVFQLSSPMELSGRTMEIRAEVQGVENAVPTSSSENSYMAENGNVCLKVFTKSTYSSPSGSSGSSVNPSSPSVNPSVPSAAPGTSASAVSSVSIAPNACTVSPGGSQAFAAQVSGTGNPPQDITWQLSGSSSANTRLVNGVLYVGADEASSELYVYANSSQDGTKSASAKVTVAGVSSSSPAAPSVPAAPAAPSDGTDSPADSTDSAGSSEVLEHKKTVNKGVYNCWQDGTAQYVKHTAILHNRIIIPASVKAGGRTYTVTALADSCIRKNQKITDVTVGKNVSSIGENAFYGCKKLRKIKITSTKLTEIGNDAFYGIASNAVVYVPRSRLAQYRILIRESGNTRASVKAYD